MLHPACLPACLPLSCCILPACLCHAAPPFTMGHACAGAKVYDLVAGARRAVPKSYYIGRDEALFQFPMLKADGLKGELLDCNHDSCQTAVTRYGSARLAACTCCLASLPTLHASAF